MNLNRFNLFRESFNLCVSCEYADFHLIVPTSAGFDVLQCALIPLFRTSLHPTISGFQTDDIRPFTVHFPLVEFGKLGLVIPNV